jgi:hypothetical protein
MSFSLLSEQAAVTEIRVRYSRIDNTAMIATGDICCDEPIIDDSSLTNHVRSLYIAISCLTPYVHFAALMVAHA